jgi:ABC-type nitrate/sulfonate/bicarbonate transport system ATPase subunit
MENPMISLQINEKSFADQIIFKAFAFSLKRGQRIGLMGPSGVGKTTLMRIISGLDKNFDGTRHIDGRLAMMFQEPTLIPWLSVRDNLSITARANEAAIQAALCTVGLANKIEAFPDTLSLGQQRRIALVRAWLYPHDCLLLDEPFASLDHDNQAVVREHLQLILQDPSVAAVIVSHNQYELEGLVNEIVDLEYV